MMIEQKVKEKLSKKKSTGVRILHTHIACYEHLQYLKNEYTAYL